MTKRDEDSSLMQLKEEFRTYEALRREHDSQIVQIAMEGGLRIAPDQWSSLLYGDQSHKSHMQSIIDKVCKKMVFFFYLLPVSKRITDHVTVSYTKSSGLNLLKD